MIDINVGALIANRLNELGMSKTSFAKRLGIANQNVNRLLEKKSMDTNKLSEIGEVLDCNFFEAFVHEHTYNEQAIANGDSSVAVAHNTGSITAAPASSDEVAVLRERVKYLQELLAEKERLIKVLLDKK